MSCGDNAIVSEADMLSLMKISMILWDLNRKYQEDKEILQNVTKVAYNHCHGLSL